MPVGWGGQTAEAESGASVKLRSRPPRRGPLRRFWVLAVCVIAAVAGPGPYLLLMPVPSWASSAAPAARTAAAALQTDSQAGDVVSDPRPLSIQEAQVGIGAGILSPEPTTQRSALDSRARRADSHLIGFPVSDHSPSSGFGYRRDPLTHLPRFHAGVDLGQPCGDPVWASLRGVVLGAGMAGGYGNRIVIGHASRNGQSFATTYNHLSGIAVVVGQTVQGGQVIGRIGSTGRSTACHMHFEVIVGGSYVDPMPYLTGEPSTANLKRPVGSYMPTGAYPTVTASASPTPTRSPATTPAKPSPQQTTASPSPKESAEPTNTSTPPPEEPPPTEEPPSSPEPEPEPAPEPEPESPSPDPLPEESPSP